MSAKPRLVVSVLLVLAGALCGCAGEGAKSDDPPVKSAAGPAKKTFEFPQGEVPKKGPDQYWVKLETTKGDIVIEVNRPWSPYGADRFHELVSSGYYDDNRFFRVVPHFVAQVGMNGNPEINAKWDHKTIPDDHLERGDPARQSNKRGYVTFAKSMMPNSRTTQVFLNLVDNSRLDSMGFTPFGKIIAGLDVLDALHDGYGEQPDQGAIGKEGNAYLSREFPKLDSIKKATVLDKKPSSESKGDSIKKADAAKK